MCGPSEQTVTQTQTTKPPKYIKQAGQQAVSQAQAAAAQPFQTPVAPVAGFSGLQNKAFDQISSLGADSPYLAAAQTAFGNAGQPITQDDINSYLNPYRDAALANMNKYVFGPQRRDTMGRARAQTGGPSADRLALTSQNLDFTQADALSQALAGFYSPAMQQAQRAKEMEMASGSGFLNLQGASQGAANNLFMAGQQQQNLAQRQLDAPYQNELARLAYPFQTADFLSKNIATIAPSQGGTTTGTQTTPGPSVGSQVLGGLTAGAGLMMGNPMMAAGGLKGATGGIPNYGYSYSMPVGGYSMPVFARRGGVIRRAAGGSVNPWDVGQGYEDGGEIDQFETAANRIRRSVISERRPGWPTASLVALGATPLIMGRLAKDTYDKAAKKFQEGGPASFEGRWPSLPSGPEGGMWESTDLSNAGIPGNVLPTPAYMIDSRFSNGNAGTINEYVDPKVGESNLEKDRLALLGIARSGPYYPPTEKDRLVPPIPRPAPAEIRAPAEPTQVTVGPRPGSGIVPQLPPAPRPNPDPSIDLDSFFAPKGKLPYPDAPGDDWGSKMARSPWMSLVAAGAKMMQTPGGTGRAIGAGLEAGVGHLEGQRKARMAEVGINERAHKLYANAMEELKRFQRSKFQQSPYMVGNEPATFHVESGILRSGITGQPFAPGTQLTPIARGSSGGSKDPALVRILEYMVNKKIATDENDAWEKYKASNRDASSYESKVLGYWKGLLQADPLLDPDAAMARARTLARQARDTSQ